MTELLDDYFDYICIQHNFSLYLMLFFLLLIVGVKTGYLYASLLFWSSFVFVGANPDHSCSQCIDTENLENKKHKEKSG